jgi:toxin ParE1/3/4
VTTAARRWRVRIAAAAEGDLRQILAWTFENFGEAQARTYAETLSSTLEALADGPTVPGVRKRPEIGRGISSIHVARDGRKGRHFVMFRAGRHQDEDVIDVLRILHDAMDFQRHLPPDAESK